MSKIKSLRLERAWSQEQLAEISGLSARTVQRLERGEAPSLETLKALAAAFDVPLNDLQDRPGDAAPSAVVSDAAQPDARRRFHRHLMIYGVVVFILVVVNLGNDKTTAFWAVYPALGWGIGLVWHGLKAYGVRRSRNAAGRHQKSAMV